MHSTRTPATPSCSGKFSKLVSACAYEIAFLRESLGEPVQATETSPFGFDPTFVATSRLFQASHMARAGDFYNNTAGLVHPVLGIPYAHSPRHLAKFPAGFPLVFDA